MNTERDISLWERRLAAVADGVCLLDGDGTVVYANAAALALAAVNDVIGAAETAAFGLPAAADICADRDGSRTFPKVTPTGKTLSASVFPLADGAIVMFLREKEVDDDGDDDEKLLLTYKGVAMAGVIGTATKLAKIDSPVLIAGESGTGKVMLARYIHRNSRRKEGGFASLNCAAMPGEMLEEELFGKAATAGEPEKAGLLTRAAGGTLFLDEINAMPLFIQTRLLYTLHDKSYQPVGGRERFPLTCRVIVATDRDLHRMVVEGDFREDLFYMIDVFEVAIPPIRQRTMDILPLIEHLAHRYNRRYGLSRHFSAEALAVLSRYPWPGNLREMNNTLERLIVMAPEDVIEVFHLPDPIRFQSLSDATIEESGSLETALAEVEADIIRRAYRLYGSSYRVAKALKISQSKANRLIRKHVTKVGGSE